MPAAWSLPLVGGWQPVTPVHECGLSGADLEGEVFDSEGWMLIFRGGVLPDSGIAHRDRLGMTGLGCGRRGGRHDIGDAAVGQALPELGDLTVTGVSGQQRRIQVPAGEFVDHLQGHQPFRSVTFAVRDLRRCPAAQDLGDLFLPRHLFAHVGFLLPGLIQGDRLPAQTFGVLVGDGAGAVGHTGLVPGLRDEQPPVQHRRRRIARGVDADRDLAVPDLAKGSGVLPGDTC
ncbi:hypothetical protein Ahu01nite_053480 [Winogradskya humida]|uniref:Uncharacterized protein n=1 Tax=Winogradskya humida TaxID=113566 RepID=A0ABQ3ZUG6_9ACTN|nr:hypothetical protein Ahu01nite_053480 [Actinoplanes humidus]